MRRDRAGPPPDWPSPALTAAGCAGSTVTGGCRIFSPIYGSSRDTAETRAQVDQHNAKGVGACGWRAR